MTRPGPGRGVGELLQVEGVSLWLSGRKVLDDVRFSLGPGEFAGLIGSNGAGKTTLLRVILGLQAPVGGHRARGGPAADPARLGDRLRPAEDPA